MTNVIGNPIAEDKVKVAFSHPQMTNDLLITVNPDDVTWAYGLNTQSYPTYGGEVVQILSVYFDDMTIRGTVKTYAELEDIYSWFISYMQIASQGTGSGTVYNQQPVTFNYYDKKWVFDIWPKSLPGFRYGRDVVAPVWSVTAAVKEPEVNFAGTVGITLSDQIMSVANFDAAYKGQLSTFGVATADFGNTADLQNNPFAASDAPAAVKGNLTQYLTNEEKNLATGQKDSFSTFLGDWTNQDLSALPQFRNASLPPGFGSTGTNSSGKSNKAKSTQKKGKVKKK